MKHYLYLPIFFIGFQLSAQSHSDCNTALLICDKTTIHVDSLYGAGADQTELNGVSCFAAIPANPETNSCWIRFSVAQSGDFYFTITPDTSIDDIDFVLFELLGGGNCQQKHELRCMAAGESSGGNSAACLGPTGLMPGEIDTTEDAGCADPDDNNFLAPLELLAGETYVLCVQNFTNISGFSIDFYGSAGFVCDTFNFPTAIHNPAQSAYQIYNIYPNPVSASFVSVDLELQSSATMDFVLVNMLGQPVRKIQRDVPAGRHLQELPVDHLPAGAYWLQMTNGRAVITKPLWVATATD